MVGIRTPGVAMPLQTPTVVVMGTVQHLIQITTIHTGMERLVVTADMEDTEGMACLPILLVIHREVALQVIIIVAQHRAGAGIEDGDSLFLKRCSSIQTRL